MDVSLRGGFLVGVITDLCSADAVQKVVLSLFSGVELGFFGDEVIGLDLESVITSAAFDSFAGDILVYGEALKAFGALNLKVHGREVLSVDA